jgi:hypothetical protein
MSKVSVIYDRKPCLIDTPPVAACQFLLRFVDSQNRSIPRVSLRIQSPNKEALRADEFGRVHVKIGARQELVAEGNASSYAPAEIRIPCTSQSQRVERYVSLEKLSR